MQGKGWRLRFPIMILLIVLILAIRWFGPASDSTEDAHHMADVTEPATRDARIYLPPLTNLVYSYVGEGMEYASFTREITFASSEALQMEDRSGTNLAQVVELSPESLRIVWTEEEFYQNESLLEETVRNQGRGGMERDLILIKAPIVQGQSWGDEAFQREIIATDEVVTVPLGTFYEVVAVKSRSLETEDFVVYEYYAKNVGLIKRVSVFEEDDAYAIVSTLSGLSSSQLQ